MPGFKALQDEFGYYQVSISEEGYIVSADVQKAYEEQLTIRIVIGGILAVILGIVIGIVHYNLESERIVSATKKAEYDAYHHDAKVRPASEEVAPKRIDLPESDTLSGPFVRVRDGQDVHFITLKGYIDNGATQTWTMGKNGYAYKVTVERLPRTVPGSVD
jgi:hypothetical protein